MATKFDALKEELKENLIEEQRIQEELEQNVQAKKKILEQMLPLVKADIFSNDYFMVKKDYEIEYDLNDPELKDYLKSSKLTIDKPILKRAIKAGIKFTNVKVKERLIVYKKASGLKEISRV